MNKRMASLCLYHQIQFCFSRGDREGKNVRKWERKNTDGEVKRRRKEGNVKIGRKYITPRGIETDTNSGKRKEKKK
jgi:hypothetical protein